MNKDLQARQAEMRRRWANGSAGEPAASHRNGGTSTQCTEVPRSADSARIARTIRTGGENEDRQDHQKLLEQRRNKRYDLRPPFSPLLRWDGATGQYDGCLSDVSMGGCFLNTAGRAGIGEIITLKTYLPNGRRLAVSAEVVHHENRLSGFGLRFVYRSDQERMMVSLLVADAGDRI